MKTTSKLCLIVMVFVFSIGLKAQSQERSYKVDLSGKEKEVVKMNLSTIASDVNYISLETTTASYITEVYKLLKTKENLLISDRTSMKRERLIIFNLNGSFKALINRVGKGPGEYSAIDDFAFDPETQIITILDSGQKKFLQFSLSGSFIREYGIDVRPFDMCFIEPGYFVATMPLRTVKPADDGKLYNIIVYDRDLKVKKRIVSLGEVLDQPNSPYLTMGGLSSFENRLRYKQPFVDDIYTLDSNLEYRIFCDIDFGTYRLPESALSSISSYKSSRDNYKEIVSMIESRNSFFIKYYFKRMTCTYLFNKSNGTMTNLSGVRGNFGITNDFDGSMPFWPGLSTGADELIATYNAIDFIEYCDKNQTIKFISKFPKQQKHLIELLKTLEKESNPVIQIVSLKI